jgi:hypothetical protein
MRYDYKGVKALAQFVTPSFEFSERAKVPLRFPYLFEEEGLDGKDLTELRSAS